MLLLANRVALLAVLARPEEADAAMRELVPAAERAGIPLRTFFARLTVADHFFDRALWDDAVTELAVLEEDPIEPEVAYRVWAHGLGGPDRRPPWRGHRGRPAHRRDGRPRPQPGVVLVPAA